MTSLQRESSRDLHIVAIANVVGGVTVLAICNATVLFRLFDASPHLASTSSFRGPSLRWDALHFEHVAEQGYIFEHEWAFFPAISWVIRMAAWISQQTSQSAHWTSSVIFSLVTLMVVDASRILYKLTLRYMKLISVARLASTMFLLSSSPATLRMAPYTEAFFTWLSYRGLYYTSSQEWLKATIFFGLASCFRSNGICLSGFVLWGLVVQPFISNRKVTSWCIIRAVFYTLIILSPFIRHNQLAYRTFCPEAPHKIDWCQATIPLMYSHVQKKYWGIGFLRYWTPQQIPNFIIAAPPIALISWFSYLHVKTNIRLVLSQVWDIPRPIPHTSPFLTSDLTPHALHALIMCFLLLFNSHTQIVLRLAVSMPITYWAAAWLAVEHCRAGKFWVCWSAMWGWLSMVLWVIFLPPA